jgi:phage-related tail fiber protein
MSFNTLLTNTGKSKLAQAQANNTAVSLIELAVGDSGGEYYEPSETQTSLVNEVWRGSINKLYQDIEVPSRIILEIAIPADTGGFYIREAGIFDTNGDLIAISKIPESYKPQQSEGATRDFYIKMIIEISSVEHISLIIDPAVCLATRAYIDTEHNNSADAHYRKIDADKVDGFHAGNKENQLAISNQTLCEKLNADMLDGYHAGNIADHLLILNKEGKVPDSNLKNYALNDHKHDVLALENALKLHGTHNMKIHSGVNAGTTTYVYPPEGFAMEHLTAFICSIREIYFAGDVNADDNLYCYWTTDSSKIIITCYNTEQRSTPAANWLAVWRK